MAAAEQASESMLGHALAYLHAELPIFPVCSPAMGSHEHWDSGERRMKACANPGKTPMVRWRGYQLDLPSEDDVRVWWSQWPTANIGMATGELSGILVLDADGTEARKECLKRGGLDETPTVWTGKVGGAHFHLTYPPGRNVRNFARRLPGTDMRGEGGYVLLPPSLHASGNRYRWAEGTQGIPTSDPPQWLLDLATGSGTTAEGAQEQRERLDIDEALKGFDQGHRDDGIIRFAGRLRYDDVPLAYAEILIQEAARNCRPPFPLEDALEKVRRIYREKPPGGATPDVDADEFFSAPSAPTEPQPDPEMAFSEPISALLGLPDVEPDWMVQDLFTVASNGWIGAEPKVGKSWIALELAYCLATGWPFLGRFAIKQPRKVLYIQEEDSALRVARRLRRIIHGDPMRPIPSDDLFRFEVRKGFKVDSFGWIEILRREIRSFGPDVILMDVFNRLHGSDENKQQDMTAILNVLTSLTNEYGCSFIVVHHNRKPQAGNEARPNQSLRGSGVLAGWGECSLFLRRGKEKNTIIVTPESKDAPEMDDFSVTIVDQDDGSVVLEMGEVEADAPKMPRGDRDVIEAVERLVAQGIGATAKSIADDLGKDRSTVQARLKRLAQGGYLDAMPISDGPFPTILYTVATR